MADMIKDAEKLLKDGAHFIEITPRRIRALFGGVWIVDTEKARYIWEYEKRPMRLYVPASDIKNADLQKTETIKEGAAYLCSLTSRSRVKKASTDRVLLFEEGAGDALNGLVKIDFGSVDQWFSEEEPIYVHPKDPYRRVEILPSSKTIRVEIDGETIAESSSSMHLHETLLPVRYYLPKTSIADWELLSESSTTSRCPYKGEANYYSVYVNGKEHKDVVWWYRYPTPESVAIAGLVCFYNEKVDIWVDGVKQERPKTHFA